MCAAVYSHIISPDDYADDDDDERGSKGTKKAHKVPQKIMTQTKNIIFNALPKLLTSLHNTRRHSTDTTIRNRR